MRAALLLLGLLAALTAPPPAATQAAAPMPITVYDAAHSGVLDVAMAETTWPANGPCGCPFQRPWPTTRADAEQQLSWMDSAERDAYLDGLVFPSKTA